MHSRLEYGKYNLLMQSKLKCTTSRGSINKRFNEVR